MKTKQLNGWWEIYDRQAEKVKTTVYGTYVDAVTKFEGIPGIEIRRAEKQPVTGIAR